MGQGISLALSLATCCAEQGRLETAPRIRECISWRPVHLASWQRKERSLHLARSPVHLLQEGSGPLFEPPVRGEGGEGGLASHGW